MKVTLHIHELWTLFWTRNCPQGFNVCPNHDKFFPVCKSNSPSESHHDPPTHPPRTATCSTRLWVWYQSIKIYCAPFKVLAEFTVQSRPSSDVTCPICLPDWGITRLQFDKAINCNEWKTYQFSSLFIFYIKL